MDRERGFALLPEGFCAHFAPAGPSGPWKARLAGLYDRMRDAGRLRAFFYDMDREPTIGEWLAYAGRPQYRFLIVGDAARDAPLGFLNVEAGRFAHFCTLPAAPRARLVAAGRQALAWAGRSFGIGELFGLTPACYRHALAYVRSAGFTPLARLQKAVYCRGRWRDAVLSRWRRGGGERREAA